MKMEQDCPPTNVCSTVGLGRTSGDNDILDFDPFQGDFGSPGDRVLKNKMGFARKAGECQNCAQEIQPGERVRIMNAVFDGDLMSYRWCALCCAAMAKSYKDNGEEYEARCGLRFAAP
ncbi:MAG: hypothetical protein ACRCV9_19025 [Burkholderiaceae bacterium]